MPLHNPGFWTASTIDPILTGKGDSLLKGGLEYCKQIAMERVGVRDLESAFSGNSATEWGNEHEADAIARYEELHFVTVHGQQEQIADGWLSCTPDGLVGSDGMVQVKCPFKSQNHLSYLLDPDSLAAQYNNQCQFELMLAGRKWDDLVSYDPRWPEPLDIVVVRIYPAEAWQARTRDRIDQAEAEVRRIVNELSEMEAGIASGS